jgi:hypothetical protein
MTAAKATIEKPAWPRASRSGHAMAGFIRRRIPNPAPGRRRKCRRRRMSQVRDGAPRAPGPGRATPWAGRRRQHHEGATASPTSAATLRALVIARPASRAGGSWAVIFSAPCARDGPAARH